MKGGGWGDRVRETNSGYQEVRLRRLQRRWPRNLEMRSFKCQSKFKNKSETFSVSFLNFSPTVVALLYSDWVSAFLLTLPQMEGEGCN